MQKTLLKQEIIGLIKKFSLQKKISLNQNKWFRLIFISLN